MLSELVAPMRSVEPLSIVVGLKISGSSLNREFHKAGYQFEWRALNSADFGVPQLRPRFSVIGTA